LDRQIALFQLQNWTIPLTVRSAEGENIDTDGQGIPLGADGEPAGIEPDVENVGLV
jgi:hypothetical protein